MEKVDMERNQGTISRWASWLLLQAVEDSDRMAGMAATRIVFS